MLPAPIVRECSLTPDVTNYALTFAVHLSTEQLLSSFIIIIIIIIIIIA